MTVWEYLRFAAEMRGLDEATFKQRMRKIVEICGLAQVLGKDIATLSHGYRQRVGLGQALQGFVGDKNGAVFRPRLVDTGHSGYPNAGNL